jgi:hypothetical protein
MLHPAFRASMAGLDLNDGDDAGRELPDRAWQLSDVNLGALRARRIIREEIPSVASR